MVLTTHAPVDTHGDETHATTPRVVRVEVIRIGDRMRRNPFWEIPTLARYAILGVDQFSGIHLLATDADGLGPVVSSARAIATTEHAVFIEPGGECRYCGGPIRAGRDYCPPVLADEDAGESGRDCETLDRGRDWRYDYPATVGLSAPAAGLVA